MPDGRIRGRVKRVRSSHATLGMRSFTAHAFYIIGIDPLSPDICVSETLTA